jgi:hypothetical protein
MSKPSYRIHAWCPRCDKTADVVTPIGPNPRIKCHWCLRDDNKTVEMKIVKMECEVA